jgi:hypothetical protein
MRMHRCLIHGQHRRDPGIQTLEDLRQMEAMCVQMIAAILAGT